MLKEFKNFVEKNNLIEKGDKILLALSGGVDSMVLAKLLLRDQVKLQLHDEPIKPRGSGISDRNPQGVRTQIP